jgi:hypothetical protein
VRIIIALLLVLNHVACAEEEGEDTNLNWTFHGLRLYDGRPPEQASSVQRPTDPDESKGTGRSTRKPSVTLRRKAPPEPIIQNSTHWIDMNDTIIRHIAFDTTLVTDSELQLEISVTKASPGGAFQTVVLGSGNHFQVAPQLTQPVPATGEGATGEGATVRWSYSEPFAIDLSTVPREPLDRFRIVYKTTFTKGDALEARSFSHDVIVDRLGFNFDLGVSPMIFQLDDDPERHWEFGLAASYLMSYAPSPEGQFARWWRNYGFKVGPHVALFTTETENDGSEIDIGLGGTVTAFNGFASAGAGWAVQRDDLYVFIGIEVLQLFKGTE